MRARRLQLLDEVEHDGDFVDAHAGGGFVEQEHVGLQREQDGDFEFALVAVVEGGGAGSGAGGQVDAVEAGVGAIGEFAAGRPAECSIARPSPALRLHGEADVFQHGQIGEQDWSVGRRGRGRGGRARRGRGA